MRHGFSIEGYSCRLRPVTVEDAAFIVEARLEDAERNKFIHQISPDVSLQQRWIEKYYTIPDDYYFVVEHKLTGLPEGLISLYNIDHNKAEWGRWVMKKTSLAATESFYLICCVAFEQLNLDEIYSLTIEDNKTVVAFHDKMRAERRRVIPRCFTINDTSYTAIEHIVTRDCFFSVMQPRLEKALRCLSRHDIPPPNARCLTNHNFEFHHIGIASYDIEKEFNSYEMLGYRKEGNSFVDKLQGVKGQFIVAEGQPRVELLQNLENSHALDVWLDNKIKMYHVAYYVQSISESIKILTANRVKVVRQAQKSAYFCSEICFMVCSNMLMIELIKA
jgi:RimJ/RimL family protein N-acetyltransferase